MQTSEMMLTVDVLSDGQISFYKKVSSEATYDFLDFYIDNDKLGSWSGEVEWSEASYTITSGTHILKWVYTKDYYVSSGQDRAWVDYIIFPPITIPVGIANDPRNITEVRTYPNPFNDNLYVNYTLPDDSPVILIIYNSLGQIIETLDLGTRQAGNFTSSLNTSGMQKGIYYYTLKAGNTVYNGKIIKTE
jgi:hypothetical protein